MDTEVRDSKYCSEFDKISHLIEADKYKLAQERIDSLRAETGEFPDLVRLQTRIDFFTSSE